MNSTLVLAIAMNILYTREAFKYAHMTQIMLISDNVKYFSTH